MPRGVQCALSPLTQVAMSAVLRLVLSLCLFCLSWAAPAQTSLRNEQVQVELLAHAPQGVQAGQTFWLGLKIEHAPHWHTYWQNPGDSGLPTQLHWQLPAGLTAGEIAWPLPKKIPIGTLANYGYEGTLLLAVPVTVPPQFQPPVTGKLRLELQAEWLVCRQECIPQEGRFALELPVSSATALHGALFDAAQAATPKPLPGVHSAQVLDGGRSLQVKVQGLPAAWRGQTLTLLPVTAGVVDNAASQGQGWNQQWEGDVWSARRSPASAARARRKCNGCWPQGRRPPRARRPCKSTPPCKAPGLRWPQGVASPPSCREPWRPTPRRSAQTSRPQQASAWRCWAPSSAV